MRHTINIYNPSGNTKAVVPLTPTSKKKKVLMGDDYIKLVFVLKEVVNFVVGDYITYSSENFYITEPQSITYNKTTGGYHYEITFEADYKRWKNKKIMYNPASKTREASFSLTANIQTHLEIVLENLDYHNFLNNGNSYVYSVSNNTKYIPALKEAKLIQYSSISILGALDEIAKAWECEYWIVGNVIYFGKCISGTAVEFAIGKNVADMSMSKNTSDFATRIYAFGSTRNIPSYYRKELLFKTPTNTDYNTSYIKITDPSKPLKSKYFRSNAYPNGQTYTSSAIAVSMDGESGTDLNTLTLSKELGFFAAGSYELVADDDLFAFRILSSGTPFKHISFEADVVYYEQDDKRDEYEKNADSVGFSGSPAYSRIDEQKITLNGTASGYYERANSDDSKWATFTFNKNITSIRVDEEIPDADAGTSFGAITTNTFTKLGGNVWAKKVSDTSFVIAGGTTLAPLEEKIVFLSVYYTNNNVICRRVVKLFLNQDGSADVVDTEKRVKVTTLASELVSSLMYDNTIDNIKPHKGAFTLSEARTLYLEYKGTPTEKEGNTDNFEWGIDFVGSIEKRTEVTGNLTFPVIFRENENGNFGSFTNRTYNAQFVRSTGDVIIPITGTNSINSNTGSTATRPNSHDRWEINPDYIYKGKMPTTYFDDLNGDRVVTGVIERHLLLPDVPVNINKETYREAASGDTNIYSYDGSGHVDAESGLPDDAVVEKILTTEDIYPKRESNVVEVTNRTLYDKVEQADGTYIKQPWKAYRVFTSEQDFDEDFIIKGETLGIKFLTGKLAGMEFDAQFLPRAMRGNGYGQCFEIVRNENYGRPLPDETLYPIARKSYDYESGDSDPDSNNYRGDLFCLVNFDIEYVGRSYIPQAEKELLGEVYKQIEKSKVDPNNYDCTMISQLTYNQWKSNNLTTQYSLGQKVKLTNKALFAEGYRDSRVYGYEIFIDRPYNAPVYIIGEESKYSTLKAMKEDINTTTVTGASYGGSNVSGGGSADIITSSDNREWTDERVLSAKRSGESFLRKDIADETNNPITFNSSVRINGPLKADYSSLGDTVVGSLKDKTFKTGDSMAGGRGFGIYLDKDGRSQAEFDDLLVRGKAMFSELEIRKLSAVGGNLVLSAASSKIEKVVEVEYSTYIAYKCYLKDDEGSTATTNTWANGDIARCQTFNVKSIKDSGDHPENIGNKNYGFRVTKDTEGGKEYLLFKWYKSSNPQQFMTDSQGFPEAGDTIVQMGSFTDTSRQNIIVLETSGSEPVICCYKGVNSFYNLNNFLVAKISAGETIFKTTNFKVTSDFSAGDEQQIVLDRGEFEPNTLYHYYDRVSYDGSLWLCINVNGSYDGYNYVVPSTSATTIWLRQVSKGATGEQGGALNAIMSPSSVVIPAAADGTLDTGFSVSIPWRVYSGGSDVTSQYQVVNISASFCSTSQSGNTITFSGFEAAGTATIYLNVSGGGTSTLVQVGVNFSVVKGGGDAYSIGADRDVFSYTLNAGDDRPTNLSTNVYIMRGGSYYSGNASWSIDNNLTTGCSDVSIISGTNKAQLRIGSLSSDEARVVVKALVGGTPFVKTITINIARNGKRGAFNSVVFKRTNTDISSTRPTGGTYDSPIPTSGDWSDGIPSGTAKLWASNRTFYGDDTDLTGVWSFPAQMTDTADFDVEFSSVEENPSDPTTTPANWSNTASEDTVWMATRECHNGVWSSWQIAKIKGERGSEVELEDGQWIIDGVAQGQYSSAYVSALDKYQITLPANYNKLTTQTPDTMPKVFITPSLWWSASEINLVKGTVVDPSGYGGESKNGGGTNPTVIVAWPSNLKGTIVQDSANHTVKVRIDSVDFDGASFIGGTIAITIKSPQNPSYQKTHYVNFDIASLEQDQTEDHWYIKGWRKKDNALKEIAAVFGMAWNPTTNQFDIKLQANNISLEGYTTINQHTRIDEYGDLYSRNGHFQNCFVEGFVSGGVFQPYNGTGIENIFVKDQLVVFCEGNANVYLPTDPEYIGARVTIVVNGRTYDSGTGNVTARTYNPIANIRAGRTYYRHTYSDLTSGITHQKNHDSIVGRVKKGLYGSQWFFSPNPVIKSGNEYFPNVISMVQGVIELVGVRSAANFYITEQKYIINENGTLEYGSGSTPQEKSPAETDPMYDSGEKAHLTQWAIVNFLPDDGTTTLDSILDSEGENW